jgi:hypothetical protein
MMMRATWRLRIGKGEAMALRFPNASRSYDTTRRAVRFWGYDAPVDPRDRGKVYARGRKGSYDLMSDDF